MTAAVDDGNPGPAPGPGDGGGPAWGPRLVRDAVTHPANRPSESMSRAELIDGIADYEAARNALDAAQAEWTRTFARAEAAHQIEHGLTEPDKIERSIAGQISPASRVSVTEARTRVRVARDLHDGLAHVRALFHAGQLSAHKVRSSPRPRTSTAANAPRSTGCWPPRVSTAVTAAASAHCANSPRGWPRRWRRASSGPAPPPPAPAGGSPCAPPRTG